jgi:hypothetical protein
MEDKIGKKPYLGIVINYDKEKNFDIFGIRKHMLKKLLLELLYLEQHLKEKQIMNWLKDFTTTVPIGGSCLALLYLVTGEQLVGYLSHAFLIMYLIAGMVYLLTSMKIYGWLVRVVVSVDSGEMLGAMGYLLLMALVQLVQFHSCML